MLNVSPDIEQEIQKRVANGDYDSPDDLLRDAIRALDESHEAVQDWLEESLLTALEGEEAEMTPEEWADIRREADRAAGINRGQ